jgi:hypothetical protein
LRAAVTSRRFESVVAASVAWLARGAAALFLFVALALLKESLPALSHASLWGFLSGSDWRPTLPNPILGILPMMRGRSPCRSARSSSCCPWASGLRSRSARPGRERAPSSGP